MKTMEAKPLDLPPSAFVGDHPLPELLRKLRAAKGLTLGGAARALDLTPAKLSTYERGLKDPSEAMLARFAELYGVPLTELREKAEAPASPWRPALIKLCPLRPVKL